MPRSGWHRLCAIHQDRNPELLAAMALYVAAATDVPEPAGDGPGWQRSNIHAIITGWNLRGVSDGSQDTVTNLLTERDELRQALDYEGEAHQRCVGWKNTALAERDAARAARDGLGRELAAVEASEDAAALIYRLQRDEARDELEQITAERDRLRGDVESLKAAYDAMCGEAHRLGEALATARRDAAADALQMAGAKLAQANHHAAADDMRGLEAGVRAGTRPASGSPEPAPAGGEED